MENNQTIEALLSEIKTLTEKIVEISDNLTKLVKISEDREKRFVERGTRTQERGSDRGNFRSRSSDSSWGNSSGFSRRDDRNRNKG